MGIYVRCIYRVRVIRGLATATTWAVGLPTPKWYNEPSDEDALKLSFLPRIAVRSLTSFHRPGTRFDRALNSVLLVLLVLVLLFSLCLLLPLVIIGSLVLLSLPVVFSPPSVAVALFFISARFFFRTRVPLTFARRVYL